MCEPGQQPSPAPACAAEAAPGCTAAQAAPGRTTAQAAPGRTAGQSGPGSTAADAAPGCTAADAIAAVNGGLGVLASLDMTALTAGEHADLLRALGRAESQAVSARTAALAAFGHNGGYEADGARTGRSWLRWQTRITPSAAAGAARWVRRLSEHPIVAAVLAAGDVSPSWARQVCDWTDGLDSADRDAADRVLLAAAAGGAELGDLAGLAEEIKARTARPDRDGRDDRFDTRSLRVAEYWEGNGLLTGDLTAECTAALRAVLDSLNARTGPEDLRSPDQRDHDALCEALQRLLAARCLPERGGQPVQVQLHMSLEQLLGQPGAAESVAEWAGYGATAPPGTECDATIVPVVTGHIDPDLLEELAAALLKPGAGPKRGGGNSEGNKDRAAGRTPPAAFRSDGGTGSTTGDTSSTTGDTGDTGGISGTKATGWAVPGLAGSGGKFGFFTGLPAWAGPEGIPDWVTPYRAARMAARPGPDAGTAARELILTRATRLLSGPRGLAAWLRQNVTTGPAAAVSQVLDIGIPTEVIPPHLRRAVALRDKHCSFPGCFRPPAACHVHHIIPRNKGGPTNLSNLALMCPFHHLIAIHRMGWQIRLNPDGTKTATSPYDGRELHSHSPPPGWVA
jgi:hypothetical protein